LIPIVLKAFNKASSKIDGATYFGCYEGVKGKHG
jgi:hypothetical protein